ncbi:MAG: hypothetical protein IJH41_00395 [Eubacterium sp.]|nr:hypothetical protein [Eubacterium sp.]MBQ3412640.1 hypothetical protein [Oscillospiraceae bacterium]
MKKTYILSSLLAVPAAVLGWFLVQGIEPATGYYSGDPLLLWAVLALVIGIVIAGFALRSYATKRGTPYKTPEHRGLWRFFNAIMAMLILLTLLCRFSYSRPDSPNLFRVWIVTAAIELIALIFMYVRIITDDPDEPLKAVFRTMGACVYFTADLLNRFLSSSVNRNNVPLMISLLCCASLAITSLRMTQTFTTGEPYPQRQFLCAAFISAMFCVGLRLPSAMFYLRTGNLFETVYVATDVVAALVLFYEAVLTLHSHSREDK